MNGLSYPESLIGTVNVHDIGYHEVVWHSIGLLALIRCCLFVEFRPGAIGT